MEQQMNEFLTYMEQIKKASANTLCSYRRDLKGLLKFLVNRDILEIEKVTETDLNSYILYLEKRGLKSATISRHITSIRMFLLFLLKKGILKTDPAERIKSPKIQHKKVEVLSQDTIGEILNEIQGVEPVSLRDRAVLELLYGTGMQISELISLKCKDINLKIGFLVCSHGSHGQERMLPLGGRAIESISAYLDLGRPFFVKQQEDASPEADFLFLNRFGGPFTRQGMWQILKSHGVSPKLLRDSFAAHMLENGADMASVNEMLGNSGMPALAAYTMGGKKRIRDVYRNSHPRA